MVLLVLNQPGWRLNMRETRKPSFWAGLKRDLLTCLLIALSLILAMIAGKGILMILEAITAVFGLKLPGISSIYGISGNVVQGLTAMRAELVPDDMGARQLEQMSVLTTAILCLAGAVLLLSALFLFVCLAAALVGWLKKHRDN